MSSNEDPAATRDQEVMETEEVEVGEGSDGDPAATRDQEVMETEEAIAVLHSSLHSSLHSIIIMIIIIHHAASAASRERGIQLHRIFGDERHKS